MKQILLFIFMLGVLNISFSQCLNTTEYSGTAIPIGVDINDGEVHQIAFSIEAGEYVVITGLNASDTYKFTSVRSDTNNPNTDYITIYDGSSQLIANQMSPITQSSIGVSTIEIHINLNYPACETDIVAHTLTIQNLTQATCNMPGAPGGITYKSNTRIDFYWSSPELSTPLGYDWRICLKDELPDNYVVSGSTVAPITNASSGDMLTPGESYWIYVRSSCASNEKSGWFRFPPDYDMNTAAPPINDFCDGAIYTVMDINTASATEATPIVGNLEGGAGTDVSAENCNGTPGNARDDVWYSFLAQTTAVNITLDPTFDGVLTLYSGNCNALTYLYCSDDPDITLANEEISANSLSVGERYYVRVYYKGTTTPVNPTFDLRIWSSVAVTDNDMDGYANHPDIDCNDANDSIHAEATEIPNNGVDEDCDGADLKTWYLDFDNDNYGDVNTMVLSNTQPSGYVSNSTDCNDDNEAVHPDATEVCDSIDNDCDGLVDDNDPSVADQVIYYVDLDTDGFGDINDPGTGYCSNPGTGYSLTNNDCNDLVASINPDASEVPNNGVDDDCDGETDETLSVSTEDFRVITISPNPFHNKIVIKTSKHSNNVIDISILDLSGREILKTKRTNSNKGIQLKHLEILTQGIYFIKLSSGNQMSTRQLIKL